MHPHSPITQFDMRPAAANAAVSLPVLVKQQKLPVLTVEYALRNTATPIGIAEYRVTDALPTDLADRLPSVQQLEAEFGGPVTGIAMQPDAADDQPE